MSTKNHTDKNAPSIAIIGGGASGLMCAVSASAEGASVTLFEKNKSQKMIASEKYYDNAYLGKKLLITGKGRCNVTNLCTREEFLNNVPVNNKFLFAAFSSFPPEKVMGFFEANGIPLKTERGNRVFPVSDRSQDILLALKRTLKENNVKIVNQCVDSIAIHENKICGLTDSNGKEYVFDKVVVCTGGISYPQTGSDGDGYRFAQSVGHTVIPAKPSLVPFEIEEDWCRSLQGLSLKNIKLSVLDKEKNKVLFSEMGEMLFTHFGISGPLVLSASSHIRDFTKDRFSVLIDLKPALDEKTLDSRLLSDFQKYNNKNIENALVDLLPHKLIRVFVALCGLSPEDKPNGITKQKRQNMVSVLKKMELSIRSFCPIEEAIITSGGVKTSEINPSTMESKTIKGLYFAGEVIDVDAYTGGFNLQIAFSTGYLAGLSAAKMQEEV